MQGPIKLALFFLPLLSAPALALDCSRAKTIQDKAICGDPHAQAADAAMSKAYLSLARRLPDKRPMQLSQRLWLRDRNNICGDELDAKLATCLAETSAARQHFLEGRPDTGPGSGGKLTPVFIQQAGRKGYYEIDVAVLKYAPPTTPAETLFNAEIDRLLKDVPSGKNDEFGEDMIYSYMLHVRMVYASPQLISAKVETYQFTGGAHGNGGTSGINIDAAKGRFLTFADAFSPTAKDKLVGECLRQILKEKAKRVPDETIAGDELKQLKTSIAEGLGKLDSWSFSTQSATVDYDAYALGAYAEGAYACKFPLAFLRPLVQAGFALP